MTLEEKLVQLTAMIIDAASELDLIFVNGPDTGSWPPPATPTINLTNGQERGVYLFGVAEA